MNQEFSFGGGVAHNCKGVLMSRVSSRLLGLRVSMDIMFLITCNRCCYSRVLYSNLMRSIWTWCRTKHWPNSLRALTSLHKLWARSYFGGFLNYRRRPTARNVISDSYEVSIRRKEMSVDLTAIHPKRHLLHIVSWKALSWRLSFGVTKDGKLHFHGNASREREREILTTK